MAVELRTSLFRELGIDFPIFSVGLAISAGPELVAAVPAATIVRDLVREARKHR
jgi:hypothetical protein